jgi:hypothetical protein
MVECNLSASAFNREPRRNDGPLTYREVAEFPLADASGGFAPEPPDVGESTAPAA